MDGKAYARENDFLRRTYPVGSIYQSLDSTSPATLFGGTWQEITGRFLLAHDGSHPAASTGGEFSHTLTVDEMPSHNHAAGYGIQFITSGSPAVWDIATGGTNYHAAANTASTGGSNSHNNTPPYLSVYMWKRTG